MSLRDPVVAWRAVLLDGRDIATDKIALGRAIESFVTEGTTRVTIDELFAAFLDLYVERLRAGKPQLLNAGRRTEMERIVGALQSRRNRPGAGNRRGRGAGVRQRHPALPHRLPAAGHKSFDEAQPDGRLILTDAAFRVFERDEAPMLRGELGARWALLKAAFEPGVFENDVRAIYLARG